MFNDEIISFIAECTNAKIENVCADLIAQRIQIQTYHHHTDATEIRTLIVTLYHSGSWKTHLMDAKKLWSYRNGVSFYRCVLPFKRFIFLISCLCFDIKETRNTEDKFAPIRKISKIFINNCTKNYNPSNMCTVLHGFRGRSNRRVYMKSKPDKYGLMQTSFNDAKTAYLVKMFLLFFLVIFIEIEVYNNLLFLLHLRYSLFRKNTWTFSQ